MSLLSDFFLARPEEIPRLDLRADLDRLPHLTSGNLLPTQLADLDFIITGERKREPSLVRDDGEEWIYHIDGDFARALAVLTDNQCREYADEWLGDVDDTISRLLQELRNLAQTAADDGQELYFYLGL